MKYFTPRLIAAYGSDDPAEWRDAEARWDSACERYHAYLATIEAKLPEGLRRLHNDYRLHDAVVRAVGRREGRFVIVLQLDSPPAGLLTVTYDLTDAPAIQAESLPAELRSSGEQVDWQYDEVEAIEGQPGTWRQSILLSNGWEIGLTFRDVQVEEAEAVLPIPRNGVAAHAPALPRTA